MPETKGFTQTVWTQIIEAGKGDRKAREDVFRKYQHFLLGIFRKKGFARVDAEDLTSDVVTTILEDEILRKADRVKGRFRSLLYTLARRSLAARLRHDNAQVRGGDVKTLSLDNEWRDDRGRTFEAAIAAHEEDSEFDAEWVNFLVAKGMTSLREECKREGRPHFEALYIFINEQIPYAQIASRMGVEEHDVKNYIFQARSRLKQLLKEEIIRYASSQEEADDDSRYLLKFLE